MARFLILFAFVVALGVAGAWLADHPGQMALVWGGYRIETSIPVLVVFLLALMGLAAFGYRTWLWLAGSPGRIGNLLRGNRREKGYKALTEGMAAIAAGEVQVATRAAEKAEKLLDSPPMAQLLRAQAAQLAGDDETAETYFRSMLETKETELVALRGLLIQAGRMGDHEQALKLAARARRLRPGATWAVRALFDLQINAGNWNGAAQTLTEGQRAGVYDPATAQHRLAVVHLAAAQAEEAAGHKPEAIARTKAALKADPGNVPAAIAEARLLASTGKQRRAARHLTQAWQQTRHPEIAEAFIALEPGLNDARRFERFQTLHKSTPGDPESLLMLGRLALAADKLMDAREAAARAVEKADPVDQRYCRLMVDLSERTDGGAERARDWLMRLSEAPPAPHWQCFNCAESAVHWTPRCGHCGQFDGLRWHHAPAPEETVQLVEKADGTSADEAPPVAVG